MRTQAPDFWNDAKQAETVMKQVRELKGWIEGCEAVSRSVDDLNVLFDFAKRRRSYRKKRWIPTMQKPCNWWKSWN